MRRIIFLTQSYDPKSTILGVTRDWVRALAERAQGVDVIALSGTPDASRHGRVRVASLGKERNTGKWAQAAAFYRALAQWLPQADAIFVHMVPRYAIMAYPLAALARCPLALWYAQGGISPDLRMAARLVNRIFTPTRDSFPLTSTVIDRKVAVTGHGIETRRYAPNPDEIPQPRTMLAVGRLSPSKRYEVLIQAAARLRTTDWRLRIAGPPLYESDRAYAAQLHEQATVLQVRERLAFLGNVSYEEMPHEYRKAWVMAHTSGTGSLDKVVLESMACGTPVVSSAPSSRAVLSPVEPSLCAPDEGPGSVAEALEGPLNWPASRRTEVGQALRLEIERHHSLAGWADQIVNLL